MAQRRWGSGPEYAVPLGQWAGYTIPSGGGRAAFIGKPFSRVASLRQRRYALQPRVAAQRLPWEHGSTEQSNPERVVSLAADGAATPLGLNAVRLSTVPG